MLCLFLVSFFDRLLEISPSVKDKTNSISPKKNKAVLEKDLK